MRPRAHRLCALLSTRRIDSQERIRSGACTRYRVGVEHGYRPRERAWTRLLSLKVEEAEGGHEMLSRVGDRRGGVQERPICARPFRLTVPHSPLHHSVSGPRHLEPDGRISRIRLAAEASSIGVMGPLGWRALSRWYHATR